MRFLSVLSLELHCCALQPLQAAFDEEICIFPESVDATMEAVSSRLALLARYASVDKSSSSLHPVGGGGVCLLLWLLKCVPGSSSQAAFAVEADAASPSSKSEATESVSESG
jgi:hypothetical protein